MSTYNPTQIYAVLKNVDEEHGGNNVAGRIIGTSIVLRESGGNSTARCLDHTATNADPPGSHSNCNQAGRGNDRGWWQWNSKAHPTITDAQADDPHTATELAYQASGGFKTWGPWSGAPIPAPGNSLYTKALTAAGANGDTNVTNNTVGSVGSGGGGGTSSSGPGAGISDIPIVGGIFNGFTSWTTAITAFFNDILNGAWWKRIGIGVLGAAAIILALILIFSKDIEHTATTTAKVAAL